MNGGKERKHTHTLTHTQEDVCRPTDSFIDLFTEFHSAHCQKLYYLISSVQRDIKMACSVLRLWDHEWTWEREEKFHLSHHRGEKMWFLSVIKEKLMFSSKKDLWWMFEVWWADEIGTVKHIYYIQGPECVSFCSYNTETVSVRRIWRFTGLLCLVSSWSSHHVCEEEVLSPHKNEHCYSKCHQCCFLSQHANRRWCFYHSVNRRGSDDNTLQINLMCVIRLLLVIMRINQYCLSSDQSGSGFSNIWLTSQPALDQINDTGALLELLQLYSFSSVWRLS